MLHGAEQTDVVLPSQQYHTSNTGQTWHPKRKYMFVPSRPMVRSKHPIGDIGGCLIPHLAPQKQCVREKYLPLTSPRTRSARLSTETWNVIPHLSDSLKHLCFGLPVTRINMAAFFCFSRFCSFFNPMASRGRCPWSFQSWSGSLLAGSRQSATLLPLLSVGEQHGW